MTSSAQHWITERHQRQLQHQLDEAKHAGDKEAVSRLEQQLHDRVVVRAADILTKRVQFGVRVTVFAVEEAEEQTFEIVGLEEANVPLGRISITSPLADALLGHQEGDEVEVTLQEGNGCVYEITHIQPPLY